MVVTSELPLSDMAYFSLGISNFPHHTFNTFCFLTTIFKSCSRIFTLYRTQTMKFILYRHHIILHLNIARTISSRIQYETRAGQLLWRNVYGGFKTMLHPFLVLGVPFGTILFLNLTSHVSL